MSPKDKISNVVISPEISLLGALKKMDSEHTKLLFVFNGDSFVSILTIGDIQRSIIKNCSLNADVRDVIDTNKVYASSSDSLESIKELMIQERTQYMPVLDRNNTLVDVILWDEVFPNAKPNDRAKIDIPVVIMAGGKGARLKPLTNVIPKPLIPIKDKTILEEIMNQFESIGCKKFYISVNYKADMINFYLSQLGHKYDTEFFQEDKPSGTIGSVALLKGKLKTPFFVSNCDIIIDQDYRDVYAYHIGNNNDITIVAAVKSYKIPYGVVEAGKDGLLMDLKEKPETAIMINSGVYIINPELIDEIPQDKEYQVTDLIQSAISRGGRVGCFPVSESSWKDMGEWPEYLKMIDIL